MMNATTMATDLDLLAERVEKAAALVQHMRDDKLTLKLDRPQLTEKDIKTLQEKIGRRD